MCATTLGSAGLRPQTRTPTLPGAPPSTSPANVERSSPSSARVFHNSGEGTRRSGGCLNHSTYAGCWQAALVTIQGRKCTPPGLAAGAHNQRGHGRGEVGGDLHHRAPDRGLHGQGVGQGRPHERPQVPPGVVLSKGSHVEPRTSAFARTARSRTQTTWIVASAGSSGAGSTSRRSADSRSSSSGRRSPTARGPTLPGPPSPRADAQCALRPARPCAAPPGWPSCGRGSAVGLPRCYRPGRAPGR